MAVRVLLFWLSVFFVRVLRVFFGCSCLECCSLHNDLVKQRASARRNCNRANVQHHPCIGVQELIRG